MILQRLQRLPVSECPVDILRPQPCRGNGLLQVAVFGFELHGLADGFVRDVDFFPDKLLADADAQPRQALFQFPQIRPLLRVVNHVDDRQNVLFPAVSHQETGPALHQLIKQALVFISAGGDRHAQRFLPGARAGYHNLPLPQAVDARPCRHLVGAVELRVVTVAFLAGKRQLFDGRVRLVHHQPAVLGAPGDHVQFRFRVDVKLKSRIAQIRLIQFRRQEIDLAAEFSRRVCHIARDRRGEQRFPLLPSDHPEYFCELALAVPVHDPEDQADACPFPQIQPDPPRRELAFVMVAESFDKPQRVPGQPIIIEPSPVSDTLQNHVVQHPDPFPGVNSAHLDLIPVCNDRVLRFPLSWPCRLHSRPRFLHSCPRRLCFRSS